VATKIKERNSGKMNKKILTTILSFCLLANNPVFAGEKLVIMGTTDIHGNVFPFDYFTQKEKKTGLAKIFSLVKKLRSENQNTVLIDAGDLIQGTPFANYFATDQKEKENPLIRVLNLMNYDALVVGNHEFDYGLEYLYELKKRANFPILSANIYHFQKEKLPFLPYTIIERKGIKIGVIGFTTPGTAKWSKGITAGKLEFKSILKEAEKWLPDLRKKVDLLIAVPHTGLGDEGVQEKSEPLENVGRILAEKFPQIDLIFLAHTHKEISEIFINNVLITQAEKSGSRLAVAEIEVDKKNERWQIIGKKAKTIDIGSFVPDEELTNIFQKEHQQTINYVSTPVAETDSEWNGKLARFQDSPLVDLINKVQAEVSGAELSAAALFSDSAVLPAGQITIADIAGLYLYENTLMAIKINGKQLKEYLEYSARYYQIDPNGEVSFNKEIPGFNYDLISGVDYQIDPRKEIGNRISGLKFNGKEVTAEMTFTLALNNYRQSGGGGYEMIKNAPVVYDKQENIRELLINYLQREKKLLPEKVFSKNWEIINWKSNKRTEND